MRMLARVVAVVAALFYLTFGLWSLLFPASFAGTVATYPPYNEHYLHDLGAFQIGLGVAALAALRWSDALGAALSGVGAASVLHVVSHVFDGDLGGRASDPYTLSLLAAFVVLGLAATGRRNRQDAGHGRSE
jgi:hypothetical protein